jgi:glutamine synthetase
MSFVQEHGLFDSEAISIVGDIKQRISRQDISKLRLAWCDQHGLVRGKTILGEHALNALANGVGFVGTNMLKDTADRTAWPVFGSLNNFTAPEFAGASDVILVPVPQTFHELPWSPGTGWVQCEAYFPDGRATPFDTRQMLRRVLADSLPASGSLQVGLEVEFHIYRIQDQNLAVQDASWPAQPPKVSLLGPGYRLLAEQRYDAIEPALDLLREPIQALGLPLSSIEVELGPSQVEFVFDHTDALRAADNMVLFRNAAKQVMRRHGYHVSFMCRPAFPEAMASGWHLHQSIFDAEKNCFAPANENDWLSDQGRHYVAGLLRDAAAAAAFSTPTINGYRRYRPNMLAPDRVTWGRDNRGAMIRVVGQGESAHVENRAGEPAANPYLYLASQLACGAAGMRDQLDPGSPTDSPYANGQESLPRSLKQALTALDSSKTLRKSFGDPFIDYYLHLKNAEVSRFEQQVTDWEQQEYFDVF